MHKSQNLVIKELAWREGVILPIQTIITTTTFLPARRYASAGYRDRNVSVRPSVRLSVRLSVRPSRAGIVSKRRKLAA